MKLDKIPLNEYPRPQLERNSYISLNGYWEYAIREEENIPNDFDGQILVPFSPESPLSGVNKFVGPKDCLFYKKELEIPKEIDNDKIKFDYKIKEGIVSKKNGLLLLKLLGL